MSEPTVEAGRAIAHDGRRLCMKYMDQINALRRQPEFYNTLTFWMNAGVNAGHVPLSWKILASGKGHEREPRE